MLDRYFHPWWSGPLRDRFVILRFASRCVGGKRFGSRRVAPRNKSLPEYFRAVPTRGSFFSIQCLENVALDSSGGAGIIRQVLTPIIHQELMTRYSAFGQSHHNVSRVIRGGRDARLR